MHRWMPGAVNCKPDWPDISNPDPASIIELLEELPCQCTNTPARSAAINLKPLFARAQSLSAPVVTRPTWRSCCRCLRRPVTRAKPHRLCRGLAVLAGIRMGLGPAAFSEPPPHRVAPVSGFCRAVGMPGAPGIPGAARRGAGRPQRWRAGLQPVRRAGRHPVHRFFGRC